MARRSTLKLSQERTIAVAAFVLLTAFFTLRGFPFHELEATALRRFEAAVGARGYFQAVEVALDWGIPKLRLRRGRLVWPDGEQLTVSYARVMPRANWGWLIARPSFYLKLNSDRGSFRGWISPHRDTAVGTVEGLALEALPYDRLGLGALRLQGQGELAFRGARGERLWEGTVVFRAVNGSAALPNTGLPIPFSLAAGSVELSEQKAEIIDEFAFEGPMGRIAITGRVARGVADPGLNLDLQMDLSDPTLLRLLADSGVRIRPGARQVHIGGTVSNPVARAGSASRRR